MVKKWINERINERSTRDGAVLVGAGIAFLIFKPIASLGDTPPKRVNATYMHGRAAGSLRPFLKAQKKKKFKRKSINMELC